VGPVTAAHDMHVSHTRMVIEGRTIVARVRVFKDDFEPALVAESKGPLTLAHDARGDSIVRAYAAAHLRVVADGKTLLPTLSDAGGESDGQQSVWWFTLEYTAAKPVTRVAVTNTMLRDRFRDQQNLVAVLFMPSEKRYSLYFVDDKPQAVP
jgi:hypothetical protein